MINKANAIPTTMPRGFQGTWQGSLKVHLEEHTEGRPGVLVREPGSWPPTAAETHSRWIQNLNMQGETFSTKYEMVYYDLEMGEYFLVFMT